MNPIPPLCSSSIPSSTGETIREASQSQWETELEALISRLDQLTPGTSDPCLNTDLEAFFPKLQQNGFFGTQTPLTWAISKEIECLVSWLLEHGARADQEDGTKKTPLSYEAAPLNLDIMELLIRHITLPDSELIRPNIYLLNQPNIPSNFREMVHSSLERLEKTRKDSHLVLITYDPTNTRNCHNLFDSTSAGKGSSTLIFYSGLESSYFSADGTSVTQPNFVGLAHELMHAHHASKGKAADLGTECDMMVWTHDEEYKTIVGFPSKNPARKTSKITENALLAELGLLERIGHGFPPHNDNQTPFSLRTQATAELYRKFCREFHYQGQAHNPPPSRRIQVTPEYFGASKKACLLHIGYSENKGTISVLTSLNLTRPSKHYLWLNYARNKWPPELELKKVCPPYADVKVYSMGIYRLSEAEAKLAETS